MSFTVSVNTETKNPGLAEDVHAFPRSAPSDPSAPHVTAARVTVDASCDRGPLQRIWESFGYDEINWTYTPTGKRLLRTFAEFSHRPYYVRPHYVFCSGSGFGIPHWGNGNVYHEDEHGKPFFDFTIADQTYDAIVNAGHHVLVELAFTPRDLLPDEAVNLVVESSPTVYSNYEAGAWAYPPATTPSGARWWRPTPSTAWSATARMRSTAGCGSCGTSLTSSLAGTPEQFYDLYSVTAAAVRSVLPNAKVGGPAVTAAGGVPSTASSRTPPRTAPRWISSPFTPRARRSRPAGTADRAPAPEQQNPSATKMCSRSAGC